MQYYQLEPFGEERADLRAGSIVAATYNVNLGRSSKKLTPEDCRLQFRPPRTISRTPRSTMTPERAAAVARAEFDAFKMMVIARATEGR